MNRRENPDQYLCCGHFAGHDGPCEPSCTREAATPPLDVETEPRSDRPESKRLLRDLDEVIGDLLAEGAIDRIDINGDYMLELGGDDPTGSRMRFADALRRVRKHLVEPDWADLDADAFAAHLSEQDA